MSFNSNIRRSEMAAIPKGENPNAPGGGSQIKVEPIREVKDINTIKRMLKDKPRDYALFTIGINTNLRASDLCRLTVGQVRASPIELAITSSGLM